MICSPRTSRHVPITLHTMTVSALLTAALALCAVLLPAGEMASVHEERAMQSFLFKLAASAREEPLHTRLRLRYTCP